MQQSQQHLHHGTFSTGVSAQQLQAHMCVPMAVKRLRGWFAPHSLRTRKTHTNETSLWRRRSRRPPACLPQWPSASLSVVYLLSIIGLHRIILEVLTMFHHFAKGHKKHPDCDSLDSLSKTDRQRDKQRDRRPAVVYGTTINTNSICMCVW